MRGVVPTNTSSAKGSPGALSSALGTLFERRWLVGYFVQRELTRSHQGSFLGLAWLILGPMLMIVIYTLVFSEIIGLRFRETDSVANFGLYLYCGLLPYLAFSETLTKSVASIKNNSSLVQKVMFPLEILPLSTALTALLTQFFGFAALLVLVLFFEGQWQWTLLLLPVVIVPQLLFVLGIGYLSSVAGVYLPDLRETMRAFVRVIFFVTPILWPADRVSETSNLRPIIDYNPLAFLVEAYRNLVLDGKVPDWTALLWFTLFAAALATVGFVLFVRVKRQFADLI